MYDRDEFETGKGPLAIIPIHHATLAFEWDGKTILCDPVGGSERYKLLETPDIVILTHHHGDHFDVETIDAVIGEHTRLVAPEICARDLPGDIAGRTQVLANGETAEIDGVGLKAVPMYNTTPERAQYHEKGVGNGYLFDFGGTNVYLASDTEPLEDMRTLGKVDVAFFPMNLPYTMTPEQVREAIARVEPRIAYPFHYRFPFDEIGTEPEDLIAIMPADGNTEIRARNWYGDV